MTSHVEIDLQAVINTRADGHCLFFFLFFCFRFFSFFFSFLLLLLLLLLCRPGSRGTGLSGRVRSRDLEHPDATG